MYGFIYITTNNVNGKRYIGQCTYHKRKSWERYLGSGKYLLMAIRKYGREQFSREIICDAFDADGLNWLEQHFIAEYDAVTDPSFYNVALGGQVTKGFKGKKHTEEYKAKRKADLLANHPRRGQKMPEGWGKKSGDARRGKDYSTPESRESSRQTGLANHGLKRSEEVKAKMSAAHKGKRCKTWIVITPLQEHLTVSNLPDFCSEQGLDMRLLRASLNRGTPSRCGWQLVRVPASCE